MISLHFIISFFLLSGDKPQPPREMHISCGMSLAKTQVPQSIANWTGQKGCPLTPLSNSLAKGQASKDKKKVRNTLSANSVRT